MTTILDPTDERVPVARTVTPRTGAIRATSLCSISPSRAATSCLIGSRRSLPSACRR